MSLTQGCCSLPIEGSDLVGGSMICIYDPPSTITEWHLKQGGGAHIRWGLGIRSATCFQWGLQMSTSIYYSCTEIGSEPCSNITSSFRGGRGGMPNVDKLLTGGGGGSGRSPNRMT